jgi:hypothetical protein
MVEGVGGRSPSDAQLIPLGVVILIAYHNTGVLAALVGLIRSSSPSSDVM